MLTINDLTNKLIIMIDGAPYQIIEVTHQHIGRGGASVQTRIKNLVTGQVFSRNFKPAYSFQEADVEKRELTYLFHHRGEYVFAVAGKPSDRYTLNSEAVGEATQWLKPNTPVTALFLKAELLTITLPIKMDLLVSEAPPGIRGNTAGAATKTAVLETGARVNVPLFVNEGDVIRVNTESGEYVERVIKG